MKIPILLGKAEMVATKEKETVDRASFGKVYRLVI